MEEDYYSINSILADTHVRYQAGVRLITAEDAFIDIPLSFICIRN